MANVKDISGQKFGRLTAVSRTEGEKWLFTCDCGNSKIINKQKARRGHTRSCGCLHKESTSRINYSHGGVGTRLYSIWESMKSRCHPTHGHKGYGLRGITMCDEWTDFNVFREWALFNGYKKPLSIERVDVNGNYCPENCTWIPLNEQSRNTRVSVKYNGETASEASRRLGSKFSSLVSSRIKRGWPKEKAFTTPVLS